LKSEKTVATRAAFRHFADVQTRWGDNDIYGHVNNAVYYAYFDSVINRYLIEQGRLDISEGKVIGLAVETGARFHGSFAFPEKIEAGLAIAHLGNSSVSYEIGLFRPGEDAARVEGHFVHVFVDRSTRQPVPMPDKIRAALEAIKR
jgi:acyl-CoA thioester hydrolase